MALMRRLTLNPHEEVEKFLCPETLNPKENK